MSFIQGKDRLHVDIVKLLIIFEDLLDALQFNEVYLGVASEHTMTYRRLL